MAPFPESEIMTIKRLEVALRRMDFKLLKDGAYKLHEKYHSGHKFEYTDLLKEIYDEVERNISVPDDIKTLLLPTIEDILDIQPQVASNQALQQFQEENADQNRVSSLTSLSYNSAIKTQEENPLPNETKEPAILNTQTPTSSNPIGGVQPFQEFTFDEPITVEKVEREIEQGSLDFSNAQPFNFGDDIFSSQKTQDIKPQEQSPIPFVQNQNEIQEPVSKTITQPQTPPQVQPVFATTTPAIEQRPQDFDFTPKTKLKSISLYFGQEFSQEKSNNISKLNDMIRMKDHANLGEFLEVMKEINTQANTNVSELQNILEQLNTRENTINFITNSQSANFLDLFKQTNTSYSIFDIREDKKINFLPLFGLSNLFKCPDCGYEFLTQKPEDNSYIKECPKCKGAMFADFYGNKNCPLNMDYYNSSIIALANSDVWLLIKPSITDKVILNMLRSALRVSSEVKEIYILDKDINVRETYNRLFSDINPNVKIDIQISAMEDFFHSIK